IDYQGNCPSAEHIGVTLPEFIKIYRAAHKTVPIIVLTRINYPRYVHDSDSQNKSNGMRDIQIKIVNELKERGDDNLYLIDGTYLLGEHFEEMTVDGVHPTDLGFFKLTEALYPILKTILMV